MEATTFLTLPAEIHVSIARHCQNHDLINLCLTSKLVNERCLHVLYRLVDLQHLRHGLGVRNNSEDLSASFARLEKQMKFLYYTLWTRPEYGKHVRVLEINVFAPIEVYLERAMQSLTQVQHVDLVFENLASFPEEHFQTRLFRSVISVRLVGKVRYSLAKSVLSAINPATLKHLCLDLVPDLRIGSPRRRFVPRDRGENARIIACAVRREPLTPLTGRFTALQTLILRRILRFENDTSAHAAAKEASYIEWASFIRSVQGTVKKFMFEQVADLPWSPSPLPGFPPSEIMDERFRRLVLPTIVSGNWPCLDNIELRGMGSSNGQGELANKLRAALGGNAIIVVKQEPEFLPDYVTPYRWN